MMRTTKRPILLFTTPLILTSCLADLLPRPRNQSIDQLQSQTENAGDSHPTTAHFDRLLEKQAPEKNIAEQKRPQVIAVNKQTFLFQQDQDKVWNAAIDVLMGNYNLNIVDPRSGVITTEWDRFYYDNGVYRNKISIRVEQKGFQGTLVTLLNNVETLKLGEQSGASASSIWLPSNDISGEFDRVIKSMAQLVDLTPPLADKGPNLSQNDQ